MEVSDVQAEAHRLMASLATAVPGELGRMVRAIVGVHGPAARPPILFIAAPTAGVASPAQPVPDRESNCDEDIGGGIEPPARSLGWASTLLALCCQAYGQPVERAVPVGACMELLGIAAVALDVAQDGHYDLLCAYGAEPQPSCSRVPRTEAATGPLVDPLSSSAVRESSIGKQQNWGRSAALVSNASVALIALFWQALLEHGPRYNVDTSTLLEIGRLIAERLVRICHAQHLDVTASCTAHLSLEEYDRMVEGKTGEIDGLACEAAAVLAGADADRQLWRTLGLERAVAQQLYDDYMDLAEDLAGGGQISHPVLYGLEVADDSRKKTILTLLDVARSGLPGAQQAAQQLRTVLSGLGAEYYTLTCIVVRRKRALAALEALHMPPQACAWLYRWVQSVDPLHSRAADNRAPWS